MEETPPRSVEEIAAKRRWNAADATVVVEAAAKSGLALRTFAEQQGIEPHRLYRWRRALRRRAHEPAPVRFAEVVVRPDLDAAHPIELVLVSGHVVRVGRGFDAEALRRLLAVLEAC
jgi:transposase-like protein